MWSKLTYVCRHISCSHELLEDAMAAPAIEVAAIESDKVFAAFTAFKWKPLNPAGSSDYNMKDLKLVPALEDGEKPFPIKDLDARAQKLRANHGFAAAKLFLKEQDNLLPEELRPYTIVFSDAVFDTPEGRRVTCLVWHKDHMGWVMVFRFNDDPHGRVTKFDLLPRFK